MMTEDESGHKECIAMFERLSEYLDNELDEITCKEIEQHIQKCMPCFVCLQTLKRTIDLCKKAEDKPVPREFSLRLEEVLRNMPKTTAP
jgi:anti-sigma factor RsiW